MIYLWYTLPGILYNAKGTVWICHCQMNIQPLDHSLMRLMCTYTALMRNNSLPWHPLPPCCQTADLPSNFPFMECGQFWQEQHLSFLTNWQSVIFLNLCSLPCSTVLLGRESLDLDAVTRKKRQYIPRSDLWCDPQRNLWVISNKISSICLCCRNSGRWKCFNFPSFQPARGFNLFIPCCTHLQQALSCSYWHASPTLWRG